MYAGFTKDWMTQVIVWAGSAPHRRDQAGRIALGADLISQDWL